MRIAVLFDSLGPYHRARLEASSRVGTLLAIQVHQRSQDYAWVPSPEPFPFESITLNPTGDASAVGTPTLNQQLARALRQFSPDCVFLPGWSRPYSHFCQWWCQNNDVATVMMSETTEHDSKRSGAKEWVKRQVIGGCAAALVGGSAHAMYLAKLGMAADQVFDGYDVVDNGYFARTTRSVRERGAGLRAKHGLPGRYFLASARFIERKNLVRLLQAFGRYRSVAKGKAPKNMRGGASDPWSLVVLGDGPEKPKLEGLIVAGGLGSCVYLPGFKQYNELPVYYGLASGFIHASTSEPWGLVVNEAMASGLPVLVSDRCGCVRDLVEEGRNGFSFKPDDVERMATLMAKIAFAGPALRGMSQASRQCIGSWGPERFARGVYASACRAMTQRPKPSLWRAAFLRLLSSR